jgi:preprotein translocase subunit SecG
VISFLAEASQVVLFLLGVFLMIVILLQRGRGGGLAGAFGGMGGQSAFGTKAGDVFTRITIVLAICWVILAGGSGYLLRAASQGQRSGDFQSGPETTGGEESSSPGGAKALDPPTTPAGGSTTPTSESGSTTPAEPPASSSISDPAPATTDPPESTPATPPGN